MGLDGVESVGGDDGPGDVQGVQQRRERLGLPGLVRDGALPGDDTFAVQQRREQVHGPIFAGGAAHHFAVQSERDLTGHDPADGDLRRDPPGQRGVQCGAIEILEQTPEGLQARRTQLAGTSVRGDPQRQQNRWRAIPRPRAIAATEFAPPSSAAAAMATNAT